MDLKFDEYNFEDDEHKIGNSSAQNMSELKEKKTFQEKKSEFWFRRCDDARVWAFWLNISNMVF